MSGCPGGLSDDVKRILHSMPISEQEQLYVLLEKGQDASLTAEARDQIISQINAALARQREKLTQQELENRSSNSQQAPAAKENEVPSRVLPSWPLLPDYINHQTHTTQWEHPHGDSLQGVVLCPHYQRTFPSRSSLGQHKTHCTAAEALSADLQNPTSNLAQAVAALQSEPSRPSRWSVAGLELGDEIGAGSFSRVYMAVRPSRPDARPMVVKVVSKSLILRENKVDSVKRERELLCELDHLCIVKLSQAFQDAHSLYFVMEYCGGGDLADLSHRCGPLTVEYVRWAAQQLCSALAYLHDRGVIHRDIKPENVVRDNAGRLRLIDLGSATRGEAAAADEPTEERRGSFVGTPQYMAPEMIEDSVVLPAGDVWALGCLLWQLLTAVRLFDAESVWLIFQKVGGYERLDWPEGVCPLAADWVGRLVVLDPAGRASWAESAAHQFFAGYEWDMDRLFSSAAVEPVTNPAVSRPARVDEDDGEAMVPASQLLGGSMLDGCPEEKKQWAGYLLPEEVVLRSSQLRKHIFLHPTTVRRFLLLYSRSLNAGRLIYIDEKRAMQRGEVSMTSETAAELHPSKPNYLTINTPQQNFLLEDPAGEASEWVRDVNALVQRTCLGGAF